MRFHYLRQQADEGRCTTEIDDTLRLYQPKISIVVNTSNQDQVPILENVPSSIQPDDRNIEVRGLRSSRQNGLVVKNVRHPMYNLLLAQYT
jgi:hypothetical protein